MIVMEKIRLFVFPHAGGSTANYYKLKPYLNGNIELYPVELAGRGDRCEEECYDTLESAVDDLYDRIKTLLQEMPYAFFGHSMGSLIAYELYYKIKNDELPEPKHIFFSGRASPDAVREDEIIYHKLPLTEFEKAVVEFDYTPEILFENAELRDFFLPILISDFRITENYIYSEKPEKIGCPISVFSGKEDDITSNELLSWKKHASVGCGIYKFNGGHFFIFKDIENVARTINALLVERRL